MPLLQVDDDTFLCESMVVTNYIAELYSDSGTESSSSSNKQQLIPKRPEDRAIMRLFIELCGSTFSYFPLLRAKGNNNQKEYDANLQQLKDGLVNTDAFLKRFSPQNKGDDNDGPFLLGNQFSLAECTVAPFVQRSCVILPAFTGGGGGENNNIGNEVIDPIEICNILGLDRLKSWIEAVCSRPSVQISSVPANDMIESTSRMLERFAAMNNA